MKCLPTSKIPQANGNILHDWHAEVLAIRAFNRFLLDECLALLKPPYSPSSFIVERDPSERTAAEFQPFKLREDVQLHMYCSEAPCGDASMELVMDAQEDATPWTSAPEPVNAAQQTQGGSPSEVTVLRGRSHFGHLGALRLKPSRPDAPPTLSKSCTDKLALLQCTSLLSSLTSLLVSPRNAYLTSLVLPQSQYVDTACLRAFSRSGRLSHISADMETRWSSSGYSFTPFSVQPTAREFTFSRRSVVPPEKPLPCNLSAVSTPHLQETLIGGVLQGRKQLDPRGASSISRRSVWKTVAEIAGVVGLPLLMEAVRKQKYRDVKGSEALASRRLVKEDVRGVLKGWVRNDGDDEFGIDVEAVR
jgi:tRNA-specific adenosine deaminase 1